MLSNELEINTYHCGITNEIMTEEEKQGDKVKRAPQQFSFFFLQIKVVINIGWQFPGLISKLKATIQFCNTTFSKL